MGNKLFLRMISYLLFLLYVANRSNEIFIYCLNWIAHSIIHIYWSVWIHLSIKVRVLHEMHYTKAEKVDFRLWWIMQTQTRKQLTTKIQRTFVVLNPHIDTKQLERKSGINQRNVLRILHSNKFHSFHILLHQELHGNDF